MSVFRKFSGTYITWNIAIYRVSVMNSINMAALQSNNYYVHSSQLPVVYNVQKV